MVIMLIQVLIRIQLLATHTSFIDYNQRTELTIIYSSIAH